MAILNRFSAILLCCDSTHFFASRCGISGDSGPAILGIVRFAIRDSVPLRCHYMSLCSEVPASTKFNSQRIVYVMISGACNLVSLRGCLCNLVGKGSPKSREDRKETFAARGEQSAESCHAFGCHAFGTRPQFSCSPPLMKSGY